jgi:hypothetical protein
MNKQIPFKISDIDLDNIVYTKSKFSKSKNKKIVYIGYQDKKEIKKLVFQTPTLLSPNSIIDNNNILEILIPLIGNNNNKTNELKTFLNKLDEKIMYDASVNSSNWFSCSKNKKSIKYKNILRESNNEKYDFEIKLKIIKKNNFQTTIFFNNNKVSPNEINKNLWVKLLIELYAVNIYSGGFSLYLRPVIMSFKKVEINDYNYQFIKSDSEKSSDSDISSTSECVKEDVNKEDNDVIDDDSESDKINNIFIKDNLKKDIIELVNQNSNKDYVNKRNSELEVDIRSRYSSSSDEEIKVKNEFKIIDIQ